MKAMHLSSPAPHRYGVLNRVVDGVLYADKVDPGSRLSNGIHTTTLTQNVVASQCGGIERGRPNVELVQQCEDLCLGIGTPVTAMRLSGKQHTCRFAILQQKGQFYTPKEFDTCDKLGCQKQQPLLGSW